MQSSPRIDELKQKFHENPRRYFAPLANEYRKAGDPEQAIALCRAHLAQQPGHMSGHVVYGQALYDAGRLDEAHDVFGQALVLDPENLIVLRHLGDIARRRGQVEEARTWYSRALDGDPQDTEVAAYLAELTEPVVLPETPRTEEMTVPFAASTDAGEVSETEAATPVAPGDAGEPVVAAEGFATAEASASAETAATPEVSEQSVEAPYAEVTPVVDTFDFSEMEATAPLPAPAVSEKPAPSESMFGDFGQLENFGSELSSEPRAEVTEGVTGSETASSAEDSPYLDEDLWRPTTPPSGVAPVDQSISREPAEEAALDDVSREESVSPEVAPIEAAPGEAQHVPAAAEESTSHRVVAEEPDAQQVTERTPTTPTTPIVTRTLAELYLEQGYIEPALEIYRQLAEREPHDEGLRARIDQLSAEATESPAAPMEGERARDERSLDEEAARRQADKSGWMEEAAGAGEMGDETTETAPAMEEPSTELWDTADSWGAEMFSEAEDEEAMFGVEEHEGEAPTTAAPTETTQAPEQVPVEASAEESPEPAQEVEGASAQLQPEAPGIKTPAAEVPMEEPATPEQAPVPEPAKRGITIKEFFATLGSMRPPGRELEESDAVAALTESRHEELAEEPPVEESEVTGAEEAYPYADDAFASLFQDAQVSPEDSRAAAALSSAVAHPPPPAAVQPRSQPSYGRESAAATGSETPIQESEEDIRRFREWLDGLANS